MGSVIIGNVQIPEIVHNSADHHIQGEQPIPVFFQQARNRPVGSLEKMTGVTCVMSKNSDDAIELFYKIYLSEDRTLFL